MENQPLLLNDDQMRQFIAEGFLVLKTDFSEEFHQHLLEQLNQVYNEEGNPGNNLLPRIPELQTVMDHPVITGALTSVLGPGYLLHSHRHGHFNNSSKPGAWHKDSYWGYKRMRNHRPWWAMIMYFPQDTPLELGPTGVLPGSQFHETRTFEQDEMSAEAKASGKAGTFALIHYDIWHRSTANLAGRERYMLKFEFMRTQAPATPSWNNREADWVTPVSFSAPIPSHEVIWSNVWNWLSGKEGAGSNAFPSGIETPPVEVLLDRLKDPNQEVRTQAADYIALLGKEAEAAGAVAALAQALEDPFEPVALNAAYGLARMGKAGTEALLAGLKHDHMRVSRTASYGLSAAGEAAVPGLLQALESERVETVVHALSALGEKQLRSREAVDKVIGLAGHANAKIRRTVVEALGMADPAITGVVSTLAGSLQDEDVQVRFMTGLSLAKLGKQADEAVPQLGLALKDENRYVRAHASDALYYIGTERAKDTLLRFLRVSRWCPTTTSANTFYP